MKLTQSILKTQLYYNKNSGLFFWIISKPRVTNGKQAGYLNSHGYISIELNGRAYQASRLAWLYMTGSFPTLQMDHKNGVRSDNSWKNLRELSQKRNIQNQHNAHSHNISGMLGVSIHKSGFKTEIQNNGKRIYLGCYKTAKEAHAVYLNEKRRLHSSCTI